MKIRLTFGALALAAVLPVLASGVFAADAPKIPSGPHPITQDIPAATMAHEVTDDVKRVRNYADQPPLIPHAIRDYQIDLNINKCLTCHDRKNTEGSQAPMISVTHFQDRDGQTLGTVSARRYFCIQCHVPQTDAKPIVGNSFVDIDKVLGNGVLGGGKEGAK